MSAPPPVDDYLLPNINNYSTHILTKGKLSLGDSSFKLNLPYTLSVNGSANVNGTYYSNNVSAVLFPSDISNNRPPAVPGYVRFNTTINALEYCNNSNQWIVVQHQPIITTVSPYNISTTDVSINGFNFLPGTTVTFIDSTGTLYPSPTVTYITGSYIKATPYNYNGTGTLPPSISPYSVRVTLPSGLSNSMYNAVATISPFLTPAGSIGTIYYSTSQNLYSLTPLVATDGTNTITYSLNSGSLPTGVSLTTVNSQGILSGVIPYANLPVTVTSPTPANTTTYSFTVKATSSSGSTSISPTYTITVYGGVATPYNASTYTSGSSPTLFVYNVPTGLPVPLTYLTVKLWGAGGGAYSDSTANPNISSSGAGGYTTTTFSIASGETAYTILVGGGGLYASGSGDGKNSSSTGTSASIGGATPATNPGYFSFGGGQSGVNGGGGGGGMSAIFAGNLSAQTLYAYYWVNTYIYSIYTNYYYAWLAQSALTSLSGVSNVIAVAGGGGGASWYIFQNNNAGAGGGLNGGTCISTTWLNNYASYAGVSWAGGTDNNSNATPGGSQTSGGTNVSTNHTTAGDTLSVSGSKFLGGYLTGNQSNGGSGGGGGGWYGGGCFQGLPNGNNAGGGGGSGFVGYQNNTTTPLTGTNYSDSTTRTNAVGAVTRKYVNSTCTQGTGVTPPNTSDAHYTSYAVTSVNGVSNGYGVTPVVSSPSSALNGGNGLVVIIY